MFKRFISVILTISIMLAVVPTGVAMAAGPPTTEIANQYLKVVVNNKNGGYVISTIEGDILKKATTMLPSPTEEKILTLHSLHLR
jgi:hypothetical protein